MGPETSPPLAGLEVDRSLPDLLEPVVFQRDLVVEMVGRPLVPPGELGQQEPYVGIMLLQVRVLERDHLAEKGIEIPVGREPPSEFFLGLLVEAAEPAHGRVDAGVHPGMIRRSLVFLPLVEDPAELLHLVLVINLLPVELGLELVELLRRGLLPYRRLFVIGLEGVEDLLRLVDEIEDEGLFLARVGAVEAREGLHGLDARQPLVDVHRVKKGLVEPRLVFLGHQEHLVFAGVEFLGQLLLLDAAVHPDLGVLLAGNVGIDDRAGESDEGLDALVALFGDVFIEGLLVPYRVKAGRSYHHGLGLASDLVAREPLEMLDHHLGLLGDVVGVKADEPGQRPACLLLVHLRVVVDRLDQPVVGLVGRVVFKHVEDEMLLDGLPHAVEVKGDGLPSRTGSAEDFEGLVLGRGGEGEEADIGLLPPLRHGPEDLLLRVRQPPLLPLWPWPRP